MNQLSSPYSQLADQALDAFWAVVTKTYPQATTGDLCPWTTVRLQLAAETAIAEWVAHNVPNGKR